MEHAGKNDEASPPVEIYTKLYVRRATLPTLPTADQMQPPGLSEIFLPTHEGSSPPILYDVWERGGQIRYRLYQEVRRGPQYHLDIRSSLIVFPCQESHLFS